MFQLMLKVCRMKYRVKKIMNLKIKEVYQEAQTFRTLKGQL